jgi:hypothetical protein
METKNIASEMESLPPEAQKQVIDFVAFLKARYASAPDSKQAKRTKLAKEPFIGMWRTRKDMQDSSSWVRCLRQREWERNS